MYPARPRGGSEQAADCPACQTSGVVPLGQFPVPARPDGRVCGALAVKQINTDPVWKPPKRLLDGSQTSKVMHPSSPNPPTGKVAQQLRTIGPELAAKLVAEHKLTELAKPVDARALLDEATPRLHEAEAKAPAQFDETVFGEVLARTARELALYDLACKEAKLVVRSSGPRRYGTQRDEESFVHSIFPKLCRAVERDPSKLNRAYVRTALAHEGIDAARAAKREPLVRPESDEQWDNAQTAASAAQHEESAAEDEQAVKGSRLQELETKAWAELRRLFGNTKDFEDVWQRYVLKLKLAEIAAQRGVSVDCIKQRINRAMRPLKPHLDRIRLHLKQSRPPAS